VEENYGPEEDLWITWSTSHLGGQNIIINNNNKKRSYFTVDKHEELMIYRVGLTNSHITNRVFLYHEDFFTSGTTTAVI